MPTLSYRRYNGWTNYETWSVVRWLGNYKGLYSLISHCDHYDQVLELFYELDYTETEDGVRWDDPQINRDEINNYFFGD